MTVIELEAKCRDKLKSEWRRVTIDPKLVLQLIEERRLLAILKGPCELRDRVLQEIAECKS